MSNFEDITKQMIPTEFEGIYDWSPGQSDEKLPPTQVHLVSRIPYIDDMIFVWRIKSRESMDNFIKSLQEHRDNVWPNKDGEE